MTDPGDLPAISAALAAAIGEAQGRLVAGHRGADVLHLIQHMRELLELFIEGLEGLGDDPRAAEAREMARKFEVCLAAVERDVVGAPLH